MSPYSSADVSTTLCARWHAAELSEDCALIKVWIWSQIRFCSLWSQQARTTVWVNCSFKVVFYLNSKSYELELKPGETMELKQPGSLSLRLSTNRRRRRRWLTGWMQLLVQNPLVNSWSVSAFTPLISSSSHHFLPFSSRVSLEFKFSFFSSVFSLFCISICLPFKPKGDVDQNRPSSETSEC